MPTKAELAFSLRKQSNIISAISNYVGSETVSQQSIIEAIKNNSGARLGHDSTLEGVKKQLASEKLAAIHLKDKIKALEKEIAGNKKTISNRNTRIDQEVAKLERIKTLIEGFKPSLNLPEQLIHVLVRHWDKECRYCLSKETTTVDHIWPKSLHGPETFLNLVGCCFECNKLKANKTVKESGLTLHVPKRFFNTDGIPDGWALGDY